MIALFVRVIASWLGISPYARWMRPVMAATSWLVEPIRRFSPCGHDRFQSDGGVAGALARPECRTGNDVIPTMMSDLGAAALAQRSTAVSFEG